MSKWNQEYQDQIVRLEFFFQRLYPTWMDIDIDFERETPDSLERLMEAVDELTDALSSFKNEVEYPTR